MLAIDFMARQLRVRIALACLVCSNLVMASAAARQDPVEREPLPFSVVDLQRRSQALQTAAESLKTLLEGWNSGRLGDEPFRNYFLERTELLKRLSKEIESDRNLRRLSQMRQGSRTADGKPEKPSVPTSIEEAVNMAEEAAELAAGINDQAAEVAGDAGSLEVRVDELVKPDPVDLCKRLRDLADRLAKGVRDGRITRQPAPR